MRGCANRLGLCAVMLCLAVTARGAATSGQAKTSTGQGTAKRFEQVRDEANRAREEGRDEEAIQNYEKALALQPEWKEGRWFLCTLLYEKERFPEAQDELRRFVADEPQTGPAWAVLGMSEYQTHEYARALDHLKRAMGWQERKELSQSVYYFTSILLSRFEQYDDGMALLSSMVKIRQQSDLYLEPLGLAALRLPLLPAEIPQDRRDLIHMAGLGLLSMPTSGLPIRTGY